MLGIGMSLPQYAAKTRYPRGVDSAVSDVIKRNNGTLIIVSGDYTQVYEDSSGTVPVVTQGSPVGRVNDSTGSHNATQSTASLKPLTSRVPKSLGPNIVLNGTFDTDTSNWSAANGTMAVVSNQLQFTATSQYGSATQQIVTIPGRIYQLTVNGRLGTSTSAFAKLRDGSGSPQSSTAQLISTNQKVACYYTATSSVSIVELQNLGASLGTSFFDNVEVREVLEWSNSLSFDGLNDFLATNHNTGTSGTMIASCQLRTVSGGWWRMVCGSGSQLPGNPGVRMGLDGSNVKWFLSTSSGSASAAAVSVGNAVANTPVVLTGTWTPSLQVFRLNGVQQQSIASRVAASAGGTDIGASRYGPTYSDDYWAGDIAAVAIFNTVLSQTDIDTIEKWMASLQGQSLEAWTPSQISTALWLDAADAGTIVQSGGLVSQWSDKSGNAHHAVQATGSLQPQTGADTIGGKNALVFADNVMTVSPNFFGASVSDAFLIVVHKVNAGGGRLFSLTGDSYPGNPSGRWQAHAPWEDGVLYFDINTPIGEDRVSAINYAVGNQPLITSFYGSTIDSLQQVFRNGVLFTGDNNASSALVSGSIEIGYQFTSIAEFLVINGTVTTVDRQRIEGYLAWKWGLVANLPADHPYKSTRPTI